MTGAEAPLEGMHEILASFGREIGLADLAFDGDGHCVLGIDAVVVNLAYDERRDGLLLYGLIGMPGGDLAATYAALLRANYLGIETKGMTLGLRPDDDALVLSCSLATSTLDLAAFQAALEAFVDTAEAWTARLPELGVAQPERPDGPLLGVNLA